MRRFMPQMLCLRGESSGRGGLSQTIVVAGPAPALRGARSSACRAASFILGEACRSQPEAPWSVPLLNRGAKDAQLSDEESS